VKTHTRTLECNCQTKIRNLQDAVGCGHDVVGLEVEMSNDFVFRVAVKVRETVYHLRHALPHLCRTADRTDRQLVGAAPATATTTATEEKKSVVLD